jgi:maltose alpha-D-glucosyltransferase/alpha-amylase
VVANLSRFSQYVDLDLSAFAGQTPVELLGRTAFPPVGSSPYFLTLGPHAFYWFRLEQRRAAVLMPSVEWPTLRAAGTWEDLFRSTHRARLEEAVAAYLPGCPWFQGVGRTVETVLLTDVIPVPYEESAVRITLVQVKYTEGEPETYLLPLACAAGPQAEEIQRDLPAAVLARLELGDASAPGVLYDPTGEKRFARVMLRAILRSYRTVRPGGTLEAQALPPLAQLQNGAPLGDPVLHKVGPSHTTLAFEERLLLKVFRRVEEGVNPALELGRFLGERTAFRQVPPTAGFIEYRPRADGALTLAVLEGFVPHQGDAWRYTLDALGRYYEHVLTRADGAHDLPLPRRPLPDLAEADLPPLALDLLGPYLEPARQLGRCAAEFHQALASDGGNPDFTPEPFSALYQRSLYQSLRSQLLRSLELLRKRLGTLAETDHGLARLVLEHEEELLRRARQITEQKLTARRCRNHGDFHLGKVLYTGKDFVIIDLEGNPQRPLSDRRRKRSPLRDVASMLRSFHYATLAASARGGVRPADVPVLEPWRRFWHLWVSVAFVKAYLDVVGREPFMPGERGELETLLSFYLLKRTSQELRDDVLRRPDRVRVPLEGFLQVLDAGR